MQLDGGPIHCDNSILSAVAECSTQAVLRYILDYASVEERATLRSGDAGHQALAMHLRGFPDAYVLAHFQDLYAEWANENVMPDDRLAYWNVARVLARYLETHPLDGLPFTADPKLVEIGFGYPLDDAGEFMFVGRMDAIVHSKAHDFPFVLDRKFRGQISDWWKRQFKLSSQLSGYVWAAERHTNHPIGGAFIDAIQLSKLPSDDSRKCKEHGVVYAECGDLHAKFDLFPVTRTPDEIEEWHKTAIHLAKRFRDLLYKYGDISVIQKVRTQGKFNGSCTFCGFYDFCATGRQQSMVDSMLVQDPWHPWQLRDQPTLATHRRP